MSDESRREGRELAALDEEREAEAEARRLERLPAGDADQGRGVGETDDSGTRPAWAFWSRFPSHNPDIEE